MKNKLKHAIIRFILYLVIILSLFAIVFSISFYTSYKMFFVPHNDVHLNGAKNLLKELPFVPPSRHSVLGNFLIALLPV